MDSVTSDQVKRRRVFYIPGYDPFPPRRYRELYRSEGKDQASISGYSLAVKGAPKADTFGWHVACKTDGQTVVADIQVLVWSDLVQKSMSAGIVATFIQLLRTVWIYVSTGALRRLMWLRKGPILAALYPISVLLGQWILAAIVLFGVSDIVTTLVGRAVSLFADVPAGGVGAAVLYWIGLACGIVAAGALLHWFRLHDRKIFAYYLMHDYAYAAGHLGANPPELDARMKAFGAKISAALNSDVDEVLVVGHSSGAHLGISILADLTRNGVVRADGPALGFLTLGHVVPMVSFLPKAHRLRADLHDLSVSQDITWVDVSAPGDGCCFALCDPVAVSGVAPQNQIWPLVISAAFKNTLSPERWKYLRRRYFRLHFQYLCAFDQPGDYDYFQITAGPMTLARRFAGRAPSKSRIDVSASPYTSMSP